MIKSRFLSTIFVPALCLLLLLCVLPGVSFAQRDFHFIEESDLASSQTSGIALKTSKGLSFESSKAANPLLIIRLETDGSLLNAAFPVNTTFAESIAYRLNGVAEKNHKWIIEDTSIASLTESKDYITVVGLKEGMTVLRLEVEASNGKTYSDYAYLSVYTPLDTANGQITSGVLATRSPHLGTDNLNERATLPAGTSLSVYGQCGSYYRAHIDFEFTDGLSHDIAFVPKNAISIPVADITLNHTSLNLKKGERTRLYASVSPSIADNKIVTWKSSDTDIVSVDQSGLLTAKKDGKAIIEASAGAKKTICEIVVAGNYKHTTLKLSADSGTVVVGGKVRIITASGSVDTYSVQDSEIATVGRDGVIEGLSPGETAITVQSPYGEKVTYKVKVQKPNAVKVTLVPVKNKKDKYKLSWSKVSGASGYQVYKYNAKKSKYVKYKTYKGAKKRTVTVPRGKYKVRTYATNKKGKTFYSKFVVAKIAKTPKGKYTITFVANGGTGKTYTQTVNRNKKVKLATNEFKRSGYAFVGWATSKKGKVIAKDKSHVYNLTKKKNIKLYAIWRSDNDPKGKVQRKALLCADTKAEDGGGDFERDIRLMKRVYESANFNGMKIETISYGNKTPAQIRGKIKELGRKTTANDVTYIHFSCHGYENGDLSIKNGARISGTSLREWLDDYVAGTVVITITSCYSGKLLRTTIGATSITMSPQKAMENFVKQFEAAGTGKKALKKNGKYKILTSANNGYGWRYGGELSVAALYWARGMGQKYSGGSCTMYADSNGEDGWGNKCYGNNDGKVTLSELYKYANPPIYDVIKEQSQKGEDPVPYKQNVPQVYPKDDNFVIFQR